MNGDMENEREHNFDIDQRIEESNKGKSNN